MKIRGLAPALEDTKVAAALEETIKQRDHADFTCFKMLQELEQTVGLDRICDLIDDDEEAETLLERLKDALNNRRELNDRFLGLLSGQEIP